jgi:hypothetical protein
MRSSQAGAVWVSRSPSTRVRPGSDEVQELVGQGVERPEQGVALDVSDGGLAGGELAQLLDPLLNEGALVEEPPGADGVDPLQLVSTWVLSAIS